MKKLLREPETFLKHLIHDGTYSELPNTPCLGLGYYFATAYCHFGIKSISALSDIANPQLWDSDREGIFLYFSFFPSSSYERRFK